jgi:putative SOS response-associated peptidase YedK
MLMAAPKSPDGWIRSCTIITTDANELLASVHDRMPVILGPDDYAVWLGEEPVSADQPKGDARALGSPPQVIAVSP